MLHFVDLAFAFAIVRIWYIYTLRKVRTFLIATNYIGRKILNVCPYPHLHSQWSQSWSGKRRAWGRGWRPPWSPLPSAPRPWSRRWRRSPAWSSHTLRRQISLLEIYWKGRFPTFSDILTVSKLPVVKTEDLPVKTARQMKLPGLFLLTSPQQARTMMQAKATPQLVNISQEFSWT